MAWRNHSRKIWRFLREDSAASWVANVVIAFIVIRYLFYPLFGLMLGTSFPIVAVVSESMEHGTNRDILCGQNIRDFQYSFQNYWKVCGSWYETQGIKSESFQKFPFSNGFNTGDVIILWRATPANLEIGDILIFQGSKPQPIIHRIVKIYTEKGQIFYQTKGDHNGESIAGQQGETRIGLERVYGQGILRIPYLGWVKILFVEAVRPLGITIQR